MIVKPTSVDRISVSSERRPAPGSQRDLARLWHAVLGRLELDVSPANFETWLRGTRLLVAGATTLVVEARSTFAANHLSEQFKVVVRRAVEEVADRALAVEFVAPGSADSPLTPVARGPVAPRVGELCPTHRFDTFHVGVANRVAVATCTGLTQGGMAATPAVVWGRPGTGKTHLLHATGAEACRAGWAVACLSAEQFTNGYVSAVRGGFADEFQSTLRDVRLLLIDDIQYLEGKRGTGDELIRTMDAVGFAGGVVVAASEVHPGRLALPDRLRSRLQAGPSIEVGCLEQDEREGFIRAASSDLRCQLPGWAIERIASMDVCSMRVLRGAVCLAVSLQQARCLEPSRLDAELVRQGDGGGRLSDAEVMQAVAGYFGVTEEEISGRSRGGLVRDARAVTVAALKDRGASLSQLGAKLDGRDSSTISGLAVRGRRLLEQSPELKLELAG